MLYLTRLGETIDTTKDLSFEERNFVQKMMIYEHVGLGLKEFQAKWQAPGNPVWIGPQTISRPTPAARIILDLEQRIKNRQT